jgi:uncharacterized protein (DUF885 family)
MKLDMSKIMDKYIHEYILLNPSFNDFLGLAKYKELRKHWENNLTDEHITLEKNLIKRYLDKMKKKKNLDVWEKSFVYDLELSLEMIDSPLIYMPLNHLDNPILGYIELSLGDSTYNFNNKEDYDFFINKTKEFDIWIDTAIHRMEQGIQKGYVLPKFSIVKIITQLKSALKTKDYMKHKFSVKLDYDFTYIIDNYVERMINKILQFLEDVYIKHATNKIGFSQYKKGKKYYRLMVKAETGLDNITVKQIHNIGLSEVNRVYQEIIKIKNEIGFQGDYKEFNNFINGNKSLKFKDKKDMDKTYKKYQKDIANNVMTQLFPDKISQKADIKPVPDYMEDGAPVAYYMPGDLLGKRKGTFYYNSQKPKQTNKYEAESLSLHEDSPGHHYQITLANMNKNIPTFIKVLDNNAYIEGWGLYSENLGTYKNTYNYLGKLNMEMLRSIRLVVDTGIHYYDWTYKECAAYFSKYSNSPEHEIESELFRYIVDPAQALSYKVGELTFLRLKKEYLNSGLDIRQFHHDVLSDGALPLAILEDKIHNIIKKHKQKK